MTKKHRIVFRIWKFWMRIIGIKKGTFLLQWVPEKNKHITAVITSLSGESATKTKLGLDINIHWLEPIKGHDSRYYTSGSYSYSDIKKNFKII